MKGQFSFEVNSSNVVFSGDFDSGNLQSVVRLKDDTFQITSSLDSCNSEVTQKSFFHFKVEGYPVDNEIKLKITNVKLLTQLQKADRLSKYRPFVKMGANSKYCRYNPSEVYEDYIGNINVVMKIKVTHDCFFVSFSEPYPYSRYVQFVEQLHSSFLEKYILTQSLQHRKIYLLAITVPDKTSKFDVMEKEYKGVFPDGFKIRNYAHKPVIIISARVHPGETPSSFAVEGIIKFLLSNDLRAYLLRKFFLILIVPMLNPDGVYHGFYRLDTLENNLNRFYRQCDLAQHPSIFAIKLLIDHYSIHQKLLFFFDIHGHPSYKGSFLYGNAFEDIIEQTESQLFCRLMQINCRTFDLAACNFSKTQMKAKDRPEEIGKEGCARVYAHRTANIVNSYTFELGFHGITTLNRNFQSINPEYRNNYHGELSFIHNPKIQINEIDKFEYSASSYEDEGIALIITILDALELNPYSKIPNSEFKNNIEIRKILLKQIFHSNQRFRLIEKTITPKILMIAEIVEETFVKKIKKKKFFNDVHKIFPPEVNLSRFHNKVIKNGLVNSKTKDIFYKTARSAKVNRLIDLQIADFTVKQHRNSDDLQIDSPTKKQISRKITFLSKKMNNTTYSQAKRFLETQRDSYKIETFKSIEPASPKRFLNQKQVKYVKQINNPYSQLKKPKIEVNQNSPRKPQLLSPTKIRMRTTFGKKKQFVEQSSRLDTVFDLLHFDDSKLKTNGKIYHNKLNEDEDLEKSTILIPYNKFECSKEYSNIFISKPTRIISEKPDKSTSTIYKIRRFQQQELQRSFQSEMASKTIRRNSCK